jgi:hypothetical protein
MLHHLKPGMVVQGGFQMPQDASKKLDHSKDRMMVFIGLGHTKDIGLFVPCTSLMAKDDKYSVQLSPGAKRGIRNLDDRPTRIACDVVNAVMMPTDIFKRQHNRDGTSSWDCGQVPNAVLKEIIKRKDMAIADKAVAIQLVKPDPTVLKELARARVSSVGSPMKPTASRDQRVQEIAAARAAKEAPRREYNPTARPTLKLGGNSR